MAGRRRAPKVEVLPPIGIGKVGRRRRARRSGRLAIGLSLFLATLAGGGVGFLLALEREPPLPEARPVATIAAPAPTPALLPRLPQAEPIAPRAEALTFAADPDAVPAWRRHAVPAGPDDGRPMLAVVIDDMGLNARRTDAFAALPGPLTFAFLPYGTRLPEQARVGRAAGHELMIHMPMEPSVPEDPGPRALEVGLSEREIVSRLEWALDRIDGHIGINNHMGSRFTADRDGMTTVMQVLRVRGLLFLDSRTTSRTVGPELATRHGVASVDRDIFLDNERNVERILDNLAKLEAQARRRGHAIAIGHPYRETEEALAVWLPELEARGVRLVPLSAIAIRKYAPPRLARRSE